ncbi:hypothetical protein COCOBI_16-4110 [Coccomyxa sp. Obi]|nr:hypothetical protein COCOBI_16-4110 [Coccomyxa sp. Obi]
MEAVNDAPYLRNRPESFVEAADVILKLDSGDTLAAHSTLLSFHSDVFSDMLSLNKPGDSRFHVLPLSDCSLDDALSFLKCIYTRCEADRFCVEGAEAVAALANKFGMDGISKDLDKFLAGKVAPDGSSSAFWGADIDKAVHWLSEAGKNNLIHLAAKAERFLVQAGARLSDSPEAVHIPPSSLLRMLDSRHAAIVGLLETAKKCADTCLRSQIHGSYNASCTLPTAAQDALAEIKALKPVYSSVQST